MDPYHDWFSNLNSVKFHPSNIMLCACKYFIPFASLHVERSFQEEPEIAVVSFLPARPRFPDFSGRLVESHFAVVGYLMDLSGHVLGDSSVHDTPPLPLPPPPSSPLAPPIHRPVSRLRSSWYKPAKQRCNFCLRVLRAIVFPPSQRSTRHCEAFMLRKSFILRSF